MGIITNLFFLLYTLLIKLSQVYIWIGSIFSAKLSLLHSGRKETFQLLNSIQNVTRKKIWIHCASLGEFEQGRPIIEKIKQDYSDYFIVVSFFSPSGYEIQKNYAFADLIIYLPSDTPNNARILIEKIQPTIVIFVKYEFWWNLIRSLIGKNLPLFLVAGVFRNNDYFFQSFYNPFLTLLRQYKKLLIQDQQSAEVLAKYGCTNYEITGDTRIDRVMYKAETPNVPQSIKDYCHQKTIIVYGSVWSSDMHVVALTINNFPNYIHILAPHDISGKNIHQLTSYLKQPYNVITDSHWQHNILIINNIGMLNSLYSLAKYVYIGGGFGSGIHNILEPAAYALPIFIGPKHEKFNEAISLIELGVAKKVQTPNDMTIEIQKMNKSESLYSQVSKQTNKYFETNRGATQKTTSIIYPYL